LLHNLYDYCVGDDSSKWSCVNRVDPDDYDERLGDSSYGWAVGENSGSRDRRLLHDTGYNYSAEVPKLGTGYYKMTLPDSTRETLMKWWHKSKHKREPSEIVAGHYINDQDIPLAKLSLDNPENLHIKEMLEKDMLPIMEYWVPMSVLKTTSTYGVRTYHRGNFMLNHFDRHDTHHASVVVNVDQVGCDEGWPLEVHLPFGVREIYLQPGEVALYEGAKNMHGRPKRSQCDEYSNIFVHYTPHDYAHRQRRHLQDEGTWTVEEHRMMRSLEEEQEKYNTEL
jgi:hypothetical protein